jgi:hypothetical protein
MEKLLLKDSGTSQIMGAISDKWNNHYRNPTNALRASLIASLVGTAILGAVEGIARAALGLLAVVLCPFIPYLKFEHAVLMLMTSKQAFTEILYAGWMTLRICRGQDLIHPNATRRLPPPIDTKSLQ